MWQRWNGTSHLFEKSDDNGSTWAPLPLDAAILNQGAIPDARLSANVAMRNANNTFASNWLSAGIVRATANAPGPTSGQGLEVQFSAGVGYLLGFDRTAGRYMPVSINGSTVQLSLPGGPALTVDTNGIVTITDQGQPVHLYVGGATRCSRGAQAAPFTLPRFSIYDDGANFCYFSYGQDAIGRLIVSSGTAPFIIATCPVSNGTGSYVEMARFTPGASPSGGFQVAQHIVAGGRIQLGGTILSASYPAWRNTGPDMECVTGDNAQWGVVRAAHFVTTGGGSLFVDLTIATDGIINGNLTVNGSRFDSVQGIIGRAGGGGTAGQPFHYYWTGAVMQGYVGPTLVGNVGGLSDERKKKDIESIPSALEGINLLRPVTFKWRGEMDEKDIQYGLIGQEVESEFPNIVHRVGKIFDDDPDDMRRIDYQALIPLLIRAVQELSEKIDQLES